MPAANARVPRHDGWTPKVRTAFLEALATTGMVRAALASVDRSASAAYALRRRDPAFRAAWNAALAQAVAPVETMLVERALAGESVRILDPGGSLMRTEHRFDSRFALRLLTRLDRKAAAYTLNSPTHHEKSAQSAQSAHKTDPHL